MDEVEIARSIQHFVPLVAEPLNVFLDRVHVFHILFGRVRVVEPQIAHAAVFFGGGEIDLDRFGVTDMQIAVRLGREPRLHVVIHAVCKVFVNKIVNKV